MTPRQQRFVEEYLVDLNAHQAALRAGYSPRSARQTVTRLLRRPQVAEAIRNAMAARAERTRISADRVLTELARIAFADIRNLADWGPDGVTLKPGSDVAADDSAAIAQVSTGAGKWGAGPRLRLHDKQRALNSIARHLGLFGRAIIGNPRERPDLAAPGPSPRQILLERLAKLAKDKLDEDGK